MTREEKLLSLYKSCLEKNYTDMSDETQQLKVKVFAMDLNLKYKDIVSLYNEAKEACENAERIKEEEAVAGEKILTLTDGEKNNYYIYKRPNGSVYCSRNNDNKKCSFRFEASRKQVLNTTYHPSQTVYTGASSGGVSMGGFHQTKAYYTDSLSNTNKGEVILIFEDERILLREITVPPKIGVLYKHDMCFESRFIGNKAQCRLSSDKFQNEMYSATMSGYSSYEEKLSMASYLTSQLCLELSVCQELVAFLYRVCNGEIPEQDEDIYIRAKKLAESDKKSDLVTSRELFKKISYYKDSATQGLNLAEKIIEAEKREEEQIQLEKERMVLKKEAQAKINKKLAIIIPSIVAVVITFVIIFNFVIIPNGKYNDAVALMDAGKYEEAIVAFEALEGYNYSAEKIDECNTAIIDERYNEAVSLIDNGNIVEAYEELIALEGYKDSADKAISIYDKYKVEKLKSPKVGDYVFFGAYEQDNDTTNGKEDIEWLVLDVKDGKVLVISKYALDAIKYNTEYKSVTWETCTLRKWLNNDFINASFNADEKTRIPTVTVSADEYSESTDPGNETQDKVFVLSITEASKYFASVDSRQCEPTDFALNKVQNVKCDWWLRTPGVTHSSAAIVDLSGDFDNHRGVGCSEGVRPAMWIEIK